MTYYDAKEAATRATVVRQLLNDRGLDAALVYYDELNVANGWYLTGWCPQFEKGAVLLPVAGDPLILGGPESEPFAKMSSAITETRNFSSFMVPGEEYPNAKIIDFAALDQELVSAGVHLRRVGIVGSNVIPHEIHESLSVGFDGVEFVDMTPEFEALRARKSPWEVSNIESAFTLTQRAYEAMTRVIHDGVTEVEVAAEGEYACRRRGASSFAFSTIVGSGERSNAVVPTAVDKAVKQGEWVMLGIAPRVNGYTGVMGDTVPVSGEYTDEQRAAINVLRECLQVTRDMLRPGVSGREIDVPARRIFEKEGLLKYLVCPFAHTVGLMEAEAPFYGPNSDDRLEEGMTLSVDVSFFGHPELHGARIETGYEITADGCRPFSPPMDALLSSRA